MSIVKRSQCGNELLRSLPADEFALLEPNLKRVPLYSGQVLVRPGKPIETIYFLEDGVAAVMATINGVRSLAGMFGREGLSGLPALLGADRTPLETFMQIDGNSALVIEAERLRDLVERRAALRSVILSFVHTAMLQHATTATSNALNLVEVRLARFLLMCHDRVDGDDLKFTHEVLGEMVCTQRSRVTLVLQRMAGTGAIRASRGIVTVANRPTLEKLAGGSYGQTEAEQRRLIGFLEVGQKPDESPLPRSRNAVLSLGATATAKLQRARYVRHASVRSPS